MTDPSPLAAATTQEKNRAETPEWVRGLRLGSRAGYSHGCRGIRGISPLAEAVAIQSQNLCHNSMEWLEWSEELYTLVALTIMDCGKITGHTPLDGFVNDVLF